MKKTCGDAEIARNENARKW